MTILFHELQWGNALLHLWNGIMLFLLMSALLMLVEKDR